MSEDLAVLFPEGKKVNAGGEEITILPFAFGQYPKAIKLMVPVIDSLKTSGILNIEKEAISIAPDWMLRITDIFVDGGEPLIELCSFASGKPRAWFDSIAGDEGIRLAMSIFEVNADFFKKRIAPMMGLSVIASPSTGSILSTSSSDQDTAEALSTTTIERRKWIRRTPRHFVAAVTCG